MTTTVSVAATMRASRADFSTPGLVQLHGDVLLEEAVEAPEGAAMLRTATGTGKTYGSLPGLVATRQIADVEQTTVVVGTDAISLAVVIEALTKFYSKWRDEDLEKQAAVAGQGVMTEAQMHGVPEPEPPTIVPMGVPEPASETTR